MGTKPIADRGSHLVKVFSPSELVIGFWQEMQPLRAVQRVIQSPALMERDTFIPLTLDNQCGYDDAFSRPIGDLPQAVFVEVVSQADSIWPSHDVWNRVRVLPPCQLLRSQREVKFFCKVHHRTLEGQAGDVATLGCREDGNESSKA